MISRRDHVTGLQVEIQALPHGEGLPLPAYATLGSAGMDLRAAVEEPIVLEPGKRCLVPTGLRIALPEGYEAQIRPRSGLAIKQGITVANAPGTVDSDYRGEVKVGLVNLSDSAYIIQRGDRIAQMVVAPVTRVTWQPVGSLDETARGAGGFGSTGS
jgi:dUTP pyrophosphatase